MTKSAASQQTLRPSHHLPRKVTVQAARFFAAAGLLLYSLVPAQSATISWAEWTSFTVGTPGTAKAVVTLPAGKVKISYKGEVGSQSMAGPGFPSWGPASTFSGGTIDNPPGSGNQIALSGGTTIDVLKFSKPVTNPVIAIWSLGSAGVQASLKYKGVPLIAFESGGPSNEFGGEAIVVKKSSVTGEEGNGTIQLSGTYRTIKFTAPVNQPYYCFTVGVPQ